MWVQAACSPDAVKRNPGALRSTATRVPLRFIQLMLDEYRGITRDIKSNRYSKIYMAHFWRVTPKPVWNGRCC
jgi:hypothetical protein